MFSSHCVAYLSSCSKSVSAKKWAQKETRRETLLELCCCCCFPVAFSIRILIFCCVGNVIIFFLSLKKTTIKILSGELGLQEGDISYDFKNGQVSLGHGEDIDLVRRKLGVCPQHNNLLGDDTCRETLRLFASLKGNLPMDHPEQTIQDAIDAEVERRLDDIDFTSKEDADKPVKTYSGGMKRKVSIAISLLGDPEVVFLVSLVHSLRR